MSTTPSTTPDPELEEIEIDLLCEAVRRRYGHDFRDYARPSLTRRMQRALVASGLADFASLQSQVLRNPACFADLLGNLTVTTTEMFREPEVFRALRLEVLPLLKSYTQINVWSAGCATGEEAYSLAVLLTEEGLYDRSRIYATDIDPRALERAREGVYGADRFADYTRNYQAAGGSQPFAHYYTAAYGLVAMDPALRRNMVFAEHNLVTDASFAEMHLVLCRNVLIYFNRALQNRVVNLIRDSLVRRGFLCIGTRESLRAADGREHFEEVSDGSRIYRLR